MSYGPWVILLAVVIYGVIHSLLASLWVKARLRHWFGPGYERWYRLVYNLIGVAALIPLLALPALFESQTLYVIPYPWVIVTLLLQALAALALVVGLWQTDPLSFLGLRQLGGLPAEEPPRLVTGGLYRWVRHPLYTAGLVFIWLAPIMTVNLLVLNIGLTAYVIVGAYFEERKLLREFGAAYAEYRQRTPMLVPGLQLLNKARR